MHIYIIILRVFPCFFVCMGLTGLVSQTERIRKTKASGLKALNTAQSCSWLIVPEPSWTQCTCDEYEIQP